MIQIVPWKTNLLYYTTFSSLANESFDINQRQKLKEPIIDIIELHE